METGSSHCFSEAPDSSEVAFSNVGFLSVGHGVAGGKRRAAGAGSGLYRLLIDATLTDGSVVLVRVNVSADVVGFAVQLRLVFRGQVTTVLRHVVLFVPHQLIFLLL